jgi:GNAT superfamily N-acetyltransferase
MSDLSIRRATLDELPIVLDILDDAAAWLRKQGIDQWPGSFSGDDTWRIDRIRSYIENGCTYLVENEAGEASATFSLTRGADPQFAHGWPDGPDSGGYVFRMAVRRKSAGQNIGSKILSWAGDEVRRWGRPWLRLDAHRQNLALQRYYEQRGFVKVGEVTAPDLSTPGRTRGSGALMQRPTAAANNGEQEGKPMDRKAMAAAWLEAANLVYSMRLREQPVSDDAWNAALEQAARTLERHASEIMADHE